MNKSAETESIIGGLIEEYLALQQDFDQAIKDGDDAKIESVGKQRNSLLEQIHKIDPNFGEEEIAA